MKKLLMLVVITVLSTALFASASPDIVQTEKGVFFLKNVRIGISNTIIGTDYDGEKIKFTKDEVTSYTKDGIQYDKVCIVKNNCTTERTAFMELVAYRNGFKVYKYEFCCAEGVSSRHLVFKNEDFIVKFDEKNKANLIAFFEH